MSIQSSLQQLDESFKKKTDLRNDFYKYLLSSASAFLAVLIAFHRDPSSTLGNHILWSLSLGMLSLGILTGSIALYGSVFYSEAAHRKLAESIRKQLKTGSPFFEPVLIGNKKIFSICAIICYASLMSSVVCFVVYAILTDVVS